ncbi:MAG: acyl-CoA dehydrogenase family protein [Alphaproteobacteria bacterium]
MSERQEISPPEPNLTPDELIARARALRPLLRERQADCERLGHVPDDVNEKLIAAGFYRTVQPRRFGGYEFDVPTFYRVMMELSRGCVETGWVVALTSGHPLLFANFPEEAQRESFGKDGDFRAPAAFGPIGTATPVEGGYRINAAPDSASGIDGSTHFIGMAAVKAEGGDAPGGMVQFILPRDKYEIVDNWQVMGMRGTGSKRVAIKDIFVPKHFTMAGAGVGVRSAEPAARTAGRLYSNPMYMGRVGNFLIGESTSVAVGGARAALDIYEEVLRNKRSGFGAPNGQTLSHNPEYQMHFGKALALVSTAEAAFIRAGEEFMEYAREEAAGGAPFDAEKDQRLTIIENKCIAMAWEAVDLIYKTAGTSASAKQGTMLGRLFRNMAVLNTHPALQLDRTSIAAARTQLGVGGPAGFGGAVSEEVKSVSS